MCKTVYVQLPFYGRNKASPCSGNVLKLNEKKNTIPLIKQIENLYLIKSNRDNLITYEALIMKNDYKFWIRFLKVFSKRNFDF